MNRIDLGSTAVGLAHIVRTSVMVSSAASPKSSVKCAPSCHVSRCTLLEMVPSNELSSEYLAWSLQSDSAGSRLLQPRIIGGPEGMPARSKRAHEA